jgi:hypothetical protein
MAVFLASAAAMFAGRAAQRTESAQTADASVLNPNEYLIDTLFRSMTDLDAVSMRAGADPDICPRT